MFKVQHHCCCQPALQRFQERNKPEYIQRMAQEKLASENVIQERVLKRRRSSLEHLEGDISAAPMKKLPAIEKVSSQMKLEVPVSSYFSFVLED